VLAHVGAFCDGDGAATPLGPAACHGEIIDLARNLDSGSVDLIVSGHTHSLVNTVVNGIPIVQARSSGAGIALVDFVRVTAAGALRREVRSEEHTSELQSLRHLVCRLLLEKKKKKKKNINDIKSRTKTHNKPRM